MESSKLLFLLRECTNAKSLRQAKLVHQRLLTVGLRSDVVLCKSLINVYFACNDHCSARLVFENMDTRSDVYIWNSLVSGYSKNSMFYDALEVFKRLLNCPFCVPDSFTYPNVIKAYGVLGREFCGRMIHTLVVKSGHVCDVVVGSSLVGMYAKFNLFGDSVQLFDEMPERDVASWNTVISCFYQSGEAEKALELFGRMESSGFEPNSVSLTVAISSCSRLMCLERGKEIHRKYVKRGFELDEYVNSALVDMYGKCDCFEMAKEVFHQMPRTSLVAWNSMIRGYVSKGDSNSCVELLNRMIIEGTRPIQTTLTSILMACSRSRNLQHGKFVHGYVIKTSAVDADIYLNCSLIDLYFKCGEVKLAETVFSKTQKDVVESWNVMISGYVSVGNWFQAVEVYDQMVSIGVKPDVVTFTSVLPACSQLAALEKGKRIHMSISESRLETDELLMTALLDMYSKCGNVKEASRIFSSMPKKDVVSWTVMISAYGSHGQPREALNHFDEMQKFGVKPDGVTFLAVLSACGHAGLIDEGVKYFSQMKSNYGIKPSFEHYSCLIDILGRAGRLLEAYEILEEKPETRDNAELLSTLFSACCLHKDHSLGDRIARLLVEKCPEDASTYTVLYNLYASCESWDAARRVRLKMKEVGLMKKSGCSWIEMNEKVCHFYAEDWSHPQAENICECLALLNGHMEAGQ
ncbi:PREDICTED: pentatricopeptide repeat-containing protein At5g27110-like [Camelina sativa]|uniref:Pentatricopeptide repeat-containing protein At5g27110-like n=1 Tax=Camelina sativa TaxID=90675 RepID=A0ABM0Y1I2_CAMSA|nr:PREDICTED: pentatricopeptide repeat-containing protein At5g27110-like [Camelina sativa]